MNAQGIEIEEEWDMTPSRPILPKAPPANIPISLIVLSLAAGCWGVVIGVGYIIYQALKFAMQLV